MENTTEIKINAVHWTILAIVIAFLGLSFGWQYLPDGMQGYFHGRLAIITAFLVILVVLGLLHFSGPIVTDHNGKTVK
jgi:uncharacterized membrane protein